MERKTMLIKGFKYLAVCVLASLVFGCAWFHLPRAGNIAPAANRLLEQWPGQVQGLSITHPYEGSMFPPDMAAPIFTWEDGHPDVNAWLVAVGMQKSDPVYRFTTGESWTPEKETWEQIKAGSVQYPARLTIVGFNGSQVSKALTRHSLSFATSKDPVGAKIMFRQVQLPFKTGEENFRTLKWRLGDIGSYGPPRVIMEDIPTCASCHQVSSGGRMLSMEMNLEGDSGAQFLVPVDKTIKLSEADFMTWSDFPKPEFLPRTRGLFARLSPSGRFVAGTVNEISYSALTGDPAFCQLFFPTYGIIGLYSTSDQTFQNLTGADNLDFVQTNPEWHPDESTLAFVRSKTMNQYHEDLGNIKTRVETVGIDELNGKFPIQFDIWTLPFNGGKGGVPKPLKGASGNGKSNYFPRYSPDGKWIVFTRSRTGIMLQPDSQLYIVPSKGGKERKMACNLNLMNSWHSWSPNGKWLLFSSKANTMYTEIFLTHIDEMGNDTPPVCLSRFSDKAYAANVPEFVDLPGGLDRILFDMKRKDN